jgi:hypothetical protein
MAVEQKRRGEVEAAAGGPSPEERRGIQLASEGAGPLLQRDYVIVLEGSACTPEAVAEKIRSDFPLFSPVELARFTRPAGAAGPLVVGDTMHVRIRAVGDCGVMVTHREPRSLTLRTLEGHPEAGRITFGAYRDEAGHLVCRIRSRARQRNRRLFTGYLMAGIHGQTRVWVTFLERLAAACGGRLLGEVLTSTDEVEELPEDWGAGEAPTFVTQTRGTCGASRRER